MNMDPVPPIDSADGQRAYAIDYMAYLQGEAPKPNPEYHGLTATIAATIRIQCEVDHATKPNAGQG